MFEEGLEKSIDPDYARQNATNSKVLTGNIKEVRIQILNFQNCVYLLECYLNYVLVCKFFLNIEEVVQELTNISDCIGQGCDPIRYLDVL